MRVSRPGKKDEVQLLNSLKILLQRVRKNTKNLYLDMHGIISYGMLENKKLTRNILFMHASKKKRRAFDFLRKLSK